jgi:hypothetical protein
MISFVRGLALALIAVGFCLPLGAPAQGGCVGLSGTAVQGRKASQCSQRERHACIAATLLAPQRQR